MTGPGLPSGGKAEYSRVTGTNNEPLSDLISKVEIKDSGGTVLASSVKSYEPQRDLISSVENNWGTTSVSKYEYQNDILARRTSVVRTGSAFTDTLGDHYEQYGYNARNELTGATTYAGSDLQNPGSEIVARRRVYAYDPIGNRLTHANGDDDATSYTSNNLNQYTEICPPPLPPVCEEPTYDADGNLTSDANWNYYWDLENRLSFVVAKTPGEGAKYCQYDYDYMNRRIRKRTYNWDPSANNNEGAWETSPSADTRFVYDGWNLLMEIDALNSNAILRKYTWGLDLSGTMQGAGGIGGLLAAYDSRGTSSPNDDKNFLYFDDANGNVGQSMDLFDGSIAARYEYDPYGNNLLDQTNTTQSGTYATTNPFRFSTKYFDAETVQYYYGRRFYFPLWGRWGNRDPIEEAGGNNLYQFISNEPIKSFDLIGLFKPYLHELFTIVGHHNSNHRLKAEYLRGLAWENVQTDYEHPLADEMHAQSPQYIFWLQSQLIAISRHWCGPEPPCDAEYPLSVIELIKKMGNTLHSIQDYYSHTDWIEGSLMLPAYSAHVESFPQDWTYIFQVAHYPYYPRTFSLDLVFGGDGSEHFGVIYYSCGYNPNGLGSPHNRYAVDLASTTQYRSRNPPFGLGYAAFLRARDTAIRATAEFVEFVYAHVQQGCRRRIFDR